MSPKLDLQGDLFRDVHVLLAQRKFARALDLVLSAKKNRIRSPYNSDANHAWYLVGEAHIGRGDNSAALTAFKRSRKADPTDWYASWAVADCYLELGKLKLAERHYRLALQSADRKHISALRYDLANTLFDQGMYSLAIPLYQQASRSSNDVVAKRARKNLIRARRRLLKRPS